MKHAALSYESLYLQTIQRLNETESFEEVSLLALFCDFCKVLTGFENVGVSLANPLTVGEIPCSNVPIINRGEVAMILEIDPSELTDPKTTLNKSQLDAIQALGGLIYSRIAYERDMHRLRKSERIVQLTFEQVGSGICQTDLEGYILDLNQKFCDILGYTRDEALGLRIKDLTHPEDWEIDLTYKDQLFRYEIPYFSMEKRYFRKDGTLIWVYTTVTLMKSDVIADAFLIGIIQDVSERKEAEALLKSHAEILEAQIKERTQELEDLNAQLQRSATIDPLTNLHNRRFLMARMEGELARSRRSGVPFCIVLCDIDHFKLINDQMGHDCGDEVLKGISKMLLAGLRESDTLGRWGGEEFLILLPETAIDAALNLCTRLKESIVGQVYHYNDHDFKVSMTFGVSVYHPGNTLQQLIIAADRAMYRGKQSGRNCVVGGE